MLSITNSYSYLAHFLAPGLIFIVRQHLQQILIGLGQFSIMAPFSGQKQELINDCPNDHHLAFETCMDPQKQNSSDGSDALEKLLLSENLRTRRGLMNSRNFSRQNRIPRSFAFLLLIAPHVENGVIALAT